ncbi:MAG: RHS repeat protein [Nitrospirae bacterium]|nr:RHS repeat protein [Fimbriimonadaceae bacterium]
MISIGVLGRDDLRIRTCREADGHDLSAWQPDHLEYDALGRRTTLSDFWGVATTTYDALGRVTRESNRGLAIRYEYDQNGNRTLMVDPSGGRFTVPLRRNGCSPHAPRSLSRLRPLSLGRRNAPGSRGPNLKVTRGRACGGATAGPASGLWSGR